MVKYSLSSWLGRYTNKKSTIRKEPDSTETHAGNSRSYLSSLGPPLEVSKRMFRWLAGNIVTRPWGGVTCGNAQASFGNVWLIIYLITVFKCWCVSPMDCSYLPICPNWQLDYRFSRQSLRGTCIYMYDVRLHPLKSDWYLFATFTFFESILCRS